MANYCVFCANADNNKINEEKEAAWNLYLTCGSNGLVKTFTANELEDDDE